MGVNQIRNDPSFSNDVHFSRKEFNIECVKNRMLLTDNFMEFFMKWIQYALAYIEYNIPLKMHGKMKKIKIEIVNEIVIVMQDLCMDYFFRGNLSNKINNICWK